MKKLDFAMQLKKLSYQGKDGKSSLLKVGFFWGTFSFGAYRYFLRPFCPPLYFYLYFYFYFSFCFGGGLYSSSDDYTALRMKTCGGLQREYLVLPAPFFEEKPGEFFCSALIFLILATPNFISSQRDTFQNSTSLLKEGMSCYRKEESASQRVRLIYYFSILSEKAYLFYFNFLIPRAVSKPVRFP